MLSSLPSLIIRTKAKSSMFGKLTFPAVIFVVVIGLTACQDDRNNRSELPNLSPAQPGMLNECEDLVSLFSTDNVSIDSAENVEAGELKIGDNAIGAHCRVRGKAYTRTGTDGDTYSIAFEMRLPRDWNGRFFYQANGGLDGTVQPALGSSFGGGPLTGALLQGFAVISSDAGHTQQQNASFGFDPQARLDYGYQAAQKLTPLAKSLIETAYGRQPDRSYFGGCSNGGRHTMVAMSRLASEYDGFLAGAPGFNLPKAAIAQIWGAQQYEKLATPGATTSAPPFLGGSEIRDLSTAFTEEERQTVSESILAVCDDLDGAADGIVADTYACQEAFSLKDDVSSCQGERNGNCLTEGQKRTIGRIFDGATTSTGKQIYNSFPYDPGIASRNFAAWEFSFSQLLDPVAVGTVFSTPPRRIPNPFEVSIDELVSAIKSTDSTYKESSLSFMTPPHPTDLSELKMRGAKVMVYHGVSDAVFSFNDTVEWYENLMEANNGDASDFARLYGIPGMNHCTGGPSTDQFDMLTPLVQWVEQGQAPDAVIASVRGPGNAGGENSELPSSWSADRTRPLCPYPKVARYNGTGSLEDAVNFSCE